MNIRQKSHNTPTPQSPHSRAYVSCNMQSSESTPDELKAKLIISDSRRNVGENNECNNGAVAARVSVADLLQHARQIPK